ncbi:hypothetical protein [Proteiniphilum sp.]|uniref:hypothetical protein n=1 Tax=Proteiniphilum sp. TaxID=1926877 RepID=UPI0033189C18
MKTKHILVLFLVAAIIVAGFFLVAYSRVWGKAELEFKIHINEQLVLESVYGESPTFAIWLEEPSTGKVKTVFVTNRAGQNDWEGKVSVPALPLWTKINTLESEQQVFKNTFFHDVDAISGATPTPGYFTVRNKVKPDSIKLFCWIEMNLAGDYNEFYKEFDEETKISDEYAIGQPALVYKATIYPKTGNVFIPEIVGMSGTDPVKMIQPVQGITTAKDIFDEIIISIVRPKPKIINNAK